MNRETLKENIKSDILSLIHFTFLLFCALIDLVYYTTKFLLYKTEEYTPIIFNFLVQKSQELTLEVKRVIETQKILESGEEKEEIDIPDEA